MPWQKVDFKYGSNSGWSEIYGAFHILNKYTGVNNYENVFWQHGLITEFEYKTEPKAILGFTPMPKHALILVNSRVEKNILEDIGYHRVYNVGLPILYANAIDKASYSRKKRSLVIAPGHLFIGSEYESHDNLILFLNFVS